MYKINDRYFEIIDNPNKAYWLGFIAADGCVSCGKLGIELNYKDDKHLIKFLNDIQSPRPIKYRTRKNNIKSVILEIRNSNLVKDLEKYNIIPRKTYNLVFPNIPKEYYKDYIRGFYDGDGTYTCVHKEECINNKKYIINRGEISCVCKCKDFLLDIYEILNTEGIKAHLTHDKRDDLYYLRIYNKADKLKFIDYIYYDNCLMLDRKKEKVLAIKKYCLA